MRNGFIEIEPGLWFEEATGYPWSSRQTRFKMITKPKKLDQYFKVKFHGKTIDWHLLVWQHFAPLYEGMQVDHKNHVRTDNRLCNLHLIPIIDNRKKKLKYKNNSTGHTGVRVSKDRWQARIQKDGKTIYIGSYARYDDACKAYDEMKAKLFSKEHARLAQLDAMEATQAVP